MAAEHILIPAFDNGDSEGSVSALPMKIRVKPFFRPDPGIFHHCITPRRNIKTLELFMRAKNECESCKAIPRLAFCAAPPHPPRFYFQIRPPTLRASRFLRPSEALGPPKPRKAHLRAERVLINSRKRASHRGASPRLAGRKKRNGLSADRRSSAG